MTKEWDKDNFLYTDSADIRKKRKNLERLCAFLKRYVSKTFLLAENSPLVLALFSKDETLLDLFAPRGSLIDDLHEDGIRATSRWDNIGFNAVSEGLRHNRTASSIGEENENPVLKKYALYFSPISMLSIYEPYEPAEQCGIAIIIPRDSAWPDYLMMIAGIAHDMMITLQFNNIATMYYERSGKGLLSIDNMMSENGEVIATYYNDELFRVLGTEPVDMYYKSAGLLIDPLPENRELWDILYQNRTVTNYPLTISAHGRKTECLATTDVFNQPSIKAHGVTFYLTTPQKVSKELSEKMANGAVKTFDNIIGQNEQFLKIKKRAAQMAATDSNLMILGESGTGKDVFAQAVHNASPRRGRPFIAINCGAVPRDLIESELFGYESGAFTGARKNGNIGKFELANGGTIFLDEIGEMPLDLQPKLLRVVEQKQLMRLGGTKTIDVDVRIIVATNANIWEMIEQKKFRSDLFYRLSTMRISLPPLRERKDDIIPLAEFFIRQISNRIGKQNIMRLTAETKKLMPDLAWRGNVRELQNLMECIVQLYPGDLILPEYIRENLMDRITEENAEELPGSTGMPVPFGGTGRTVTKEDILSALRDTGGNRTDAAKRLGIARRTLYRRLVEFGIE